MTTAEQITARTAAMEAEAEARRETESLSAAWVTLRDRSESATVNNQGPDVREAYRAVMLDIEQALNGRGGAKDRHSLTVDTLREATGLQALHGHPDWCDVREAHSRGDCRQRYGRPSIGGRFVVDEDEDSINRRLGKGRPSMTGNA